MRGIIYHGQSRPSKAITYLQGSQNSSQKPISTGIDSHLPHFILTMSLVDISVFFHWDHFWGTYPLLVYLRTSYAHAISRAFFVIDSNACPGCTKTPCIV